MIRLKLMLKKMCWTNEFRETGGCSSEDVFKNRSIKLNDNMKTVRTITRSSGMEFQRARGSSLSVKKVFSTAFRLNNWPQTKALPANNSARRYPVAMTRGSVSTMELSKVKSSAGWSRFNKVPLPACVGIHPSAQMQDQACQRS